jgi:hypothetical protein
MFEVQSMDANEAARELRTTLRAPATAFSVSKWVQNDRTYLMVRIDPRFIGSVEIPKEYKGFQVLIRPKLQIKAL